MAKRRQMVVAAVGMTVSALLPTTAVYAGGGGSLPAPGAAAGAGRGTEYCCTMWTPRTIGHGNNAITVLDGTGCLSIDDPVQGGGAANRNGVTCQTRTAVKCRGELYTPSVTIGAGSVDRCLSP